jgi:DNA-binding response OmpR family regulator
MHTPLKIVVLEDHDELRDLTVAALAKAGHDAQGAYDAEELDTILAERSVDLLIVDLNLPGEQGLSVVTRLKACSPHLFIIVMTALGALQDRVKGYDHGADLYLCKPVSEPELLSAVANMARRLASTQPAEQALVLHTRTFELVGEQRALLTDTEVKLLAALAQAMDRSVPSYRLLELTGREVDARSKASLEVQMVKLRKKIAQAGYAAPSIRAIKNDGYRLMCSVRLV